MKQILLVISVFILCNRLAAQVTAQWNGPERDGIFPESGLLKAWPEAGPAMMWSATGVGTGNSSIACDGKFVYVTGRIDKDDVITAFTLDGKRIWQTPFGKSFDGSFPDTRTTPTVEGEFIYVISGKGNIACLRAKDGTIKWTVDGLEKFQGKTGRWGTSESPLIVDEKLIYTPGGSKTSMVALNKNTGETIWESESLDDNSAYASPILVNFGGKRFAVNLLATYLFGVDIDDGSIGGKVNYDAVRTKSTPADEHFDITPVSPIFKDGFIYVTGGYNHVGAKFDLSSTANPPVPVWIDSVLDCHHGGVVLVDGYLYGSNWINNGNGNWCCIDWNTGKKMYEQKWINKGSIISADGMLYCFEEKSGNLALVRPNPAKFDMVSSFKIPMGTGPYWAHPVIKDGILYVRHGDVVMAYKVKA